MSRVNKLFVYGTLGPGRPNEHLLKKIGGTWKNAKVRGTMHQVGWGVHLGFPALALDDDGEIVYGFLFTSDNLEKYWDELDEFEGEAYERVLATVATEDDKEVEAYVYAMREVDR